MPDAFRERVVRLFQDAIHRPEDHRATYLAEAFAGDAKLIAGVLTLLGDEPSQEDGVRSERENESTNEVAEETVTITDTEWSTSEERSQGEAVQDEEDEGEVGLATVRYRGSPSVSPLPRRFGNYELLEPIARGGMGIVYKARQTGLDRLVALKMILSGDMADEEEVARFQTEAKAAARLQHPGIVSIHEVGEHKGQHFFSMELVDGKSLKQAAAKGPIAPQRAAQLVRQIAEAVEYAHQQGVIHRDLKPSNILLDEAGEPRVSDFGLAKSVKTDDHLTTTGQVLGTPSYMPPEQARGRKELVGELSDVYALGAILYSLLTGRPPFQTASVPDTLQQVIHDEPISPRQLNGKVDRDLETICLKCLEKSSSRRYASAGLLAEELKRFIDGIPIQARPIGRFERLRRWRQRNPVSAAWIGLFVASMLTGVAVSSYFAVVAMGERDAARQSLIAEHAALQETRRTIDAYVDTVFQEELLRDERFGSLLKKLLGDALAHYQEFIRTHAHDDEQLADLANAVRQVAEINHQIGTSSDALEAYQEAISHFKRLLERHPDRRDFSRSLATCYSNLGLLYQSLSQPLDASQAFEAALEIGKRLVAADPRSAEDRDLLADVLNNLANLHRASGDIPKAVTTIQQVIDGTKPFAEKDDARPDDIFNLGTAHVNLGGILAQGGQPEQALEAYERGNKMLTSLIKSSDEAEYYSRLGEGLNGVAGVYLSVGRVAEARNAYVRAAEIFKELESNNPNVPENLRMLAVCHNNLGNVDLATGALESSLAQYVLAGAGFERLLRVNPRDVESRHSLAASQVNAGYILAKFDRTTEADAQYRRALRALRAMHEKDPSAAVIQRDLGYALGAIGDTLCQTGDHRESLPWYEESLTELEQLLAKGPNGDAQQFKCEFLARHAIALARTGDHAGALRQAGQAVDESAAPQPLYDAAMALALASAQLRADKALPESERDQKAEQAAARAVSTLRRLQQAGFFEDPQQDRGLRSKNAFESLQSREDFKQLLDKPPEEKRP